ncbi:MAG: polymerase subunit delta [Solirubrobacteraceae bacterium]|jgi:DNA polymerase-3 subunit delta'|nr:polymerase subunit delta [Solirubrobacteraceae bacterium]
MLPHTERHPHARAVLGAALAPGGAPSHAYLFCGPAGSGKRTVARAFATALLTEGAPDPDGAAVRIAHGAHPDLTWVAPASAAGILVGDVDQAVVAGAARTPFEAQRRVFVIEDADELNDQAANRMLKTLEEPPSFAHLILLTSRPGEVLPTIASRCQAVRFDAPSAEQIAARLEGQGVAPDTALACARLGLGDARRALALALGEGPAIRAGAEAVARGALRGEIAARPWSALLAQARTAGARAGEEVEAALDSELQYAISKDHGRLRREAAERGKRAARRAQTAALDRGLALVGLWLRDVACVLDGAAELVHNSDRAELLAQDAALGVQTPALREAQGLVERTRASFELNPNEELALDALGSRLARSLAG